MSESTEKLEAELQALRENLGELKLALEGVVREKSEAAKMQGQAFKEHCRDQLHQHLDAGFDYVRDEPVKAIALVAGVSFLLGFCLRRF